MRKTKAKLWYTSKTVPTVRGQETVQLFACSLCGRTFQHYGTGAEHCLQHG